MKKKTFNFISILILMVIVTYNLQNPILILQPLNEMPCSPSDWTLIGEPIYIDNDDPLYSWSFTAESYDWCSGSGTWVDPYLIENVTIIGAETGYSILIRDSSVPFIIRNCQLYACSGVFLSTGIQLINTKNGLLIDNNCSNNQVGITMQTNSNNNTLSQNICNDNYWFGILMEQDCNNNTLVNNVAQNNTNGLFMRYNCINNNIINNTFKSNYFRNNILFSTGHGIYIEEGCNHTKIKGNFVTFNGAESFDIRWNCYYLEISNNTIEYNTHGIDIGGWSEYSVITNNYISHNPANAILISSCPRINVTKNQILNNGNGIVMGDVQDANIMDNFIINCSSYGIDIQGGLVCENNYLFNNTFIGNGQNARENDLGINNNWSNNFWDDYRGVDANGDNIGDTPYDVPEYPSGNSVFDYSPQYFFDYLFIDNSSPKNWEASKNKGYCTGSGTQSDPYVIKDILVDYLTKGYFNQVKFLKGIIILNSEAYFKIENCTIVNLEHTALEIINTKNGLIENNNFSYNGWDSVIIQNSQNITIFNNTITYNGLNGIKMSHSYFSKIKTNLISNNGQNGLIIQQCNNDEIIDNLIQFNILGEIFCDVCTTLKIVNNLLQNDGNMKIAIKVLDCDYCKFDNNSIQGQWTGIEVLSDSDYNVFVNNFIDPGVNGICIHDFESNDNLIYLNTIISAILYAYDESRLINYNYWDNGSIGNYWGNYAGIDANDDGIGDTPYTIPGSAGRKDRFPIFDDGENGISPIVTIISPQTDSVFTTLAPEFYVHITELYLNCSWYQIDGVNQNYTFMGESAKINQDLWNELSEGLILLKIFANDSSGNIGSDFVTLYKDLTKPEIEILLPCSYELFGNATISYELFINEPHLDSIWYSLNNGSLYFVYSTVGIINFNAWNSCANGTVTLRFFANDSGNNINYQEVTLRKDNIIPDILIISPLSGTIFGNNTISFELNIFDPNLNNSWYTINSDLEKIFFHGYIGYINQTKWNALENGSIVLTFYANDSVGNISFKSIQIYKDSTPPIIQVINPLSGRIFGNLPFNFQLAITEGNFNKSWYELEDGNKYFFLGASGSINETAWSNVLNGYITFRFYANDTYGNIGFTEILIEKDIIPPLITILSPLSGKSYERAPSFNITYIEKNFESMWYTINNNSHPYYLSTLFGVIDESIWSELTYGKVNITFYVRDIVGNLGIASITIEKSSPGSSLPSIESFNPIFIIILLGISILSLATLKRKNLKV